MQNFAIVTILLIVISVAAGGVFYQYHYMPLENDRKDIEAELRRLDGEKTRLKDIDRELDALNKQIAELTEEENELQMESNQLETVVPRLLESTEIVSNKFDVKFQDIRISPLVRAEQWSELPVEFTVLGTFDQLGKFLRVVEERRIVNLAAGSMHVAVSADRDDEHHPLLNVTLSAVVYIMGSGM